METTKSPRPVLEPALVAPRDADKRSDNFRHDRHDNSKMVRGEMLYKTKEKSNPA